jgi:hypothetical protein
LALDLDVDLAADPCQRSQIGRQNDADHASV